MADTNNYVLGRGEVFFDAYAPGTQNVTGERYLGNTPALTMTTATQALDHYSSDHGIRVKDDSITLQLDRSGSVTMDNISIDNLAMMFGLGEALAQSQASVTGAVDVVPAVKLGLVYQIGRTDDTPDGVRNITSVVVTDNSGVRAHGTLNFDGQPTAADTVTVHSQVITFVSGTPGAAEVQIGGSATVTAQGLKNLINENTALYGVTASGTGILITLTANATGTAGNSIGLVASGAHPVASAADLASGTNSVTIIQSENYTVDLGRARLQINDDAALLVDGDDIEIVYNISSGTRTIVVDQNNTVEGALRFIADNARGDNKDYYWPRVRIYPNGDFALKGDTWQQMVMNFDVLQLGSLERVYVSPAPV